MKKAAQLYYISNHEWYMAGKPVGYICLALLVVNLVIGIAGTGKLTQFDPQLPLMPMRFEQFVSSSGFLICHVLALSTVLLYIAFSWQRLFTPVRSIDFLYRLPLGINRVFLVKLICGGLLLIAVQIVQLFSIVSIYFITFQPATKEAEMSQVLYLAFIRSPYLRLLLPRHPADIIFLLLSAFALAIIMLTLVNLTRYTSRKAVLAAGTFIAALAVWSLITAYNSLDSLRSLPVQLTGQLPLLILGILLCLLNLRWLGRRELV